MTKADQTALACTAEELANALQEAAAEVYAATGVLCRYASGAQGIDAATRTLAKLNPAPAPVPPDVVRLVNAARNAWANASGLLSGLKEEFGAVADALTAFSERVPYESEQPQSAPAPAEAPLVIETGRYYRTRGGRRAQVKRWEEDEANYPWIGEIYGWETWTLTGAIFLGHEYGGDLVAPWPDEPTAPAPRFVIEAGRHYRTRDGRKAWVDRRSEDGEANYPWIGKTAGQLVSWTPTGRVGILHEDSDDLVAPWPDEPAAPAPPRPEDTPGTPDGRKEQRRKSGLRVYPGGQYRGDDRREQPQSAPAAEPVTAAPLKIEVGKFYVTRNGQRKGPMEWSPDIRSRNGRFPWRAVDADGWASRWTITGAFYDDGGERPIDLVAEWTEEPAKTLSRDEAAKVMLELMYPHCSWGLKGNVGGRDRAYEIIDALVERAGLVVTP